ncbi:hypothetical protein Ddye_011531 [Dipteronia dyeriana]|uniref:Uncharacterized protein n=1 Tax=Dipteronia dyeriana TaxID=168575 RepID=A0AAD9X2Q0_9ROSI|nr:hypothetical protein Ddye_011531 [Dipteronia dyeriana]
MIDMALTAKTPIANGAGAAPKLSYACSNRRRLNPTKQLVGSIKLFIYTPNGPNLSSSSSRVQASFPVQASNSNNPQIDDPDDTSQPQEDLNYLLTLGAGSVVGAAVIKYGSILFPEITRPNIFQALIMISTPVIVTVFLLIKQSRAEQQS